LARDNNVSMSTASALTMQAPTIPGAGRESLVVGRAFAMDNGKTSGLIKGETGVFMVKVTNKEEAAKLDNYSTYADNVKTANESKVSTAVFAALKEAAVIEDKRSIFY
jgi:peptidyl-prolyl cis-trans isomerase D